MDNASKFNDFDNGFDSSVVGQDVRYLAATLGASLAPYDGTTDLPFEGLMQKPVETGGRGVLRSLQGSVSKVRAGAAFTAGDFLEVDANGKFISYATATRRYAAIALQSAGAEDEIVPAIFLGMGAS